MLEDNSLVGTRLGKYEVISLIGRGGMGVVYLAHEQTLQRPVALKVLAANLARDESYAKRFLNEARSAAALAHPSIVAIHEAGGGGPGEPHYIAMEYVKGVPLSEHIRNGGRIPLNLSLDIARQVAEALHEAHAAGLVHRDIKPANIMVEDSGRVKVLDFGLAKAAASTTGLTAQGARLGTPAYMAPEQVRGGRVDARTDIYALGVTLFEMLSGKRPFDAQNPLALMFQIDHAPFPDVSSVALDVPPAVARIVSEMTAHDAKDRYQSADLVNQHLELLLRGGVPEKLPSVKSLPPAHNRRPALQTHAPHRPRDKWVAAVLGMLVCLGVILAGYLLAPSPSADPQGASPKPAVAEPTQTAREETKPKPVVETVDPVFDPVAYQKESAPMGRVEKSVDLGLGVAMDLVWVPAGEFMMGAARPANSGLGSRPQHRVRISKGFWMGKYEVTQQQWAAVMPHDHASFSRTRTPFSGFGPPTGGVPVPPRRTRGRLPSRLRVPTRSTPLTTQSQQAVENDTSWQTLPVTRITWDECQEFTDILNQRVRGGGFRLPTEAEWEYACRAGSTTRYCYGDDESMLREYANILPEAGIRSSELHQVGQKRPNSWALHNMHGNVREWCRDWFDIGYYKESPVNDPTGPVSGEERVVRGGCYRSNYGTGSAYKGSSPPNSSNSDCGFRIVCTKR